MHQWPLWPGNGASIATDLISFLHSAEVNESCQGYTGMVGLVSIVFHDTETSEPSVCVRVRAVCVCACI